MLKWGWLTHHTLQVHHKIHRAQGVAANVLGCSTSALCALLIAPGWMLDRPGLQLKDWTVSCNASYGILLLINL
jgi:hypothetical protein